MRETAGQSRRAIAALARGSMTPGASLVIEALSCHDGCGVGSERIACCVGLLRRHRHSKRSDRTGKKRDPVNLHLELHLVWDMARS